MLGRELTTRSCDRGAQPSAGSRHGLKHRARRLGFGHHGDERKNDEGQAKGTAQPPGQETCAQGMLSDGRRQSCDTWSGPYVDPFSPADSFLAGPRRARRYCSFRSGSDQFVDG